MFSPTAAGQTELQVLTLMLYVHAVAGFSNRCGRRWLSNLSRKEFRLLLKHFNGLYCFGLSGSKTKLQVLRPPAGRLHYDAGVRAQQGFAGTDVYFLDLSVWRLFFPRRWPSRANTPSPTTLTPERFSSAATAASAAASGPAASGLRSAR